MEEIIFAPQKHVWKYVNLLIGCEVVYVVQSQPVVFPVVPETGLVVIPTSGKFNYVFPIFMQF